MQCPHDQSELQEEHYEGDVLVDRCPTCSGVFLDVGELREIQETRERDYRQHLQRMPDLVGRAHAAALAASRPAVSCPRCEVPMERREHASSSQILVDVCSQCRGRWLDAGELAALEVFFERVQQEVAVDANEDNDRSLFWRLRDLFGGVT